PAATASRIMETQEPTAVRSMERQEITVSRTTERQEDTTVRSMAPASPMEDTIQIRRTEECIPRRPASAEPPLPPWCWDWWGLLQVYSARPQDWPMRCHLAL